LMYHLDLSNSDECRPDSLLLIYAGESDFVPVPECSVTHIASILPLHVLSHGSVAFMLGLNGPKPTWLGLVTYVE
jgi:hypothetical protein